MSLTVSLNTALSGLTASQTALGTIAQNVANANTVGYSRQVIELQARIVAGEGSGVEVSGINRFVDSFLIREVRIQRSSLGAAEAAETFFNEIQSRFGPPSSNSTISAELADFAAALDALAISPEDPARRFGVVAAAIALARSVSDLATGIQALRAEADKEIKAAVDTINTQLRVVDDLNVAITRALLSGANTSTLEDQRDRAVAVLADNIDITTFVGETGAISILTSGGQALLENQLRQLDYTPAATMASTTVFGAITVFTIDRASGANIGSGDVIVTGGVSSAVVNGITSGRLKGLLDIRDQSLNKLADQVETLATAVRDGYNAIHNAGVSFPAPNGLTGTRTVSSGDAFAATGTVRIAVVDASGAIVGTPLDLDLGALGATTVGAVVTAINAALGANATAAVVNGKLTITAADSANGIAINESTSQVTGATQAFSDYFGLNDIFIGTGSIGLAVRADVVADPGLLATGLLSLTAAGGETGTTIGDNRVMQQLAALTETGVPFAAVGGLPAGTFTIGQYADAITGLNAVQAAEAIESAALNRFLFENLDNRATSFSGVNVDEELANMIVFQNAFAASARVMATVSEMLDLLIEIAG